MFGKNKNKRRENDFYSTPDFATEALLEREIFYGDVWEPCCGSGSISKILQKHNFQVYSSDLVERGFGDINIDFLIAEKRSANIITNPPYSLAEEFLFKAKEASEHKIALLLRTAFVESAGRYDLFQDKKFPLKKILQFSKRINFLEKGSPNFCSAWFIWDKEYIGNPTIEWIK